MTTDASSQNSPPPQPQEQLAWHTLTPEQVAGKLEANTENGLDDASVAKRLTLYGPNKLADKPPPSPWLLFIEQFKSLLIALLMGAAVLAGLIGHFRDAIAIMVVTVLNSFLGFYQEYRAEQSLQALKRMLTLHPRVLRNGHEITIEAEELVPGDLVLLETGDRIAADGRLIELHSLEIDESTLTGESHPVAKHLDILEEQDTPLADRVNMAFMNTVVTRGRAWMIVTATGGNTEIGRLALALAEEDEGSTPLQLQLDHLGKRLSLVAGGIVGVIFLLGLLMGTPLAEMVLQAIALAVAAIPEGLPAVVTVTLALGMRRMVKAQAIVKRLLAVETLGCTTVICSDKTGTLTLNQMTARGGFYRGGRFTVSGEGYQPEGEIRMDESYPGKDDPEWSRLLTPLALCNDSHIEDGALTGDPTEGALLTLAYKGGIKKEDEEQRM
ncbi:MAG: HAD-IC family P-type ATPase, partial [Deltaproteobacteria bacterium]|nr:HAD-IC family P-type ATPase [Deltaproteobacteria bacterium]